MSPDLPTRDGVLRARARLEGRIVRTPLLSAGSSGRPLWLKPEVLQRTGSFKIRGALNFIGALSGEQRERGVVAYSSGNHAQGVAAAAAEYGVAATIVMPEDAPPIKLRNTRRLGATVVTYDRAIGVREEIATEIANETGGVIVPPYDHRWTIEGQGTIGLELLEDLATAGVTDAMIVVPISGGGLVAGIALGLEGSSHSVVGAEPIAYDDHRRSLEAGERVKIEPEESSICDALLRTVPGEITFAINRVRLGTVVTATDAEVLTAMRWAFEESKLVVEPGGAIGLAALQSGVVPGDGPVVVVLSGGNVDPRIMERALSA